MDVLSLGSDLVPCLPLIVCGATVAMLAFVAMGPTVSHGVKYVGVNSWAAVAAAAAATLGTLVVELGDCGGEGEEAGVAVDHGLGEDEVRLYKDFDGVVLLNDSVGEVV